MEHLKILFNSYFSAANITILIIQKQISLQTFLSLGKPVVILANE